jgi:cyclohexyl-isocyanide hydratase
MQIAMLLFPKLTQLDLTGPHEVLARMPDARVELVAKDPAPVVSETGLAIVPTATFDAVKAADLLFVPGGYGQIAAADDGATVGWLQAIGKRATWVTSTCTGALLLGKAGLLRGYRATTHWAYVDLLPMVGAMAVRERVVRDRNRITGAGVTAGIDVALAIAAELHGAQIAEEIALYLEYGPMPSDEVVERVRARLAKRHAERAAHLAR